MSRETWIAVTDSSECKIFAIEARMKNLKLVKNFSPSEFNLVKKLISPQSRMHTDELVGNLYANTHGGSAFGRRAIESKINPHRKEKIKFSHEIADFLNKKAQEQKFGKLILLAAPEFLGYIRKMLHQKVNSLLIKEVNKDLVHASNEKIYDHLFDKKDKNVIYSFKRA